MKRQIHHDCFTYLTQAVAGEVEALQGLVLIQRFSHHHGGWPRQLIGAQMQVTQGVVAQQGFSDGLASLISQTVETQVEGQKSGVLGQGVSDGFGPRVSNIIVTHVQDLQLTPGEQLADSSGSSVSDLVVREVKLPEGWVVQKIFHQQPALIVFNVAFSEPQDLERQCYMRINKD